MRPEESSQLKADMGPVSEKIAVQTTELVPVPPMTAQPLVREQKAIRRGELDTEVTQLDSEPAFPRDSRQALMKASRTLLDEGERCEAVNEMHAASEEVRENALVFQEGRKMHREMRRLESLRAAWLAPRCEHTKPNGMRCGSPAVGGEKFCFFHGIARNNAVEFPVVEDRRGLQVAILRVCERLANNSIAPANAKILLDGLCMAAENACYIAREDCEL